MALSHNNLGSYLKTNFAMMQHHNYSLSDIENMIPWERDVYVAMLIDYIKEENEKRKNRG
ncbi:MAG: hypothetical protein HOF75_08230 [Flavobacteriaceae bacterium]|jgi:hypothetical protein|nr:hypothetical protein [Flavobacteriaceae bacterium]